MIPHFCTPSVLQCSIGRSIGATIRVPIRICHTVLLHALRNPVAFAQAEVDDGHLMTGPRKCSSSQEHTVSSNRYYQLSYIKLMPGTWWRVHVGVWVERNTLWCRTEFIHWCNNHDKELIWWLNRYDTEQISWWNHSTNRDRSTCYISLPTSILCEFITRNVNYAANFLNIVYF